MKHSLKRILPVLLAIVLICSLFWYFFVYDRAFTRDMLLYSARYFDSRGSHSISAWLYDQAYRQAEDNEAVAIELAQRFKEMGNYTKAENTLTGAISDGGSAELYIALCQTYIEQDKLLDAVTMLDHITHPEIKAQLDAMRPAAPTVDAEPGFYSQYLPIAVSAPGGRLYLTTDGEYPSIQDAPSTGALTLVNGENTIYALCVGENGLVSPLAIFGYTVGGVIEEVKLTDGTVDALVRQQLNLSANAPLYSNQLWTLTSLELPKGADSYKDLARLSYLQSLTIRGGSAQSLAGLEGLTQLTELTLENCRVTNADLKIIAALPKLQKLTLTGCSLSDISSLSDARTLTHLDLHNNSIRDISALSFMSGLLELDLSHNALDNLNALSSLSGLQKLDVSYNSLTSVFPLSSCVGLTELRISNNTISAVTGLENLTRLTKLNASYNSLSEVAGLAALTELTELDLSSNSLTNISALAPLKKLQTFLFSRNQVSSLPNFGTDCALVLIDGSYNQITNLSALSGYENLNQVLMDYNKISSVKPLADCHKLIKVNVFGNPVKDVSSLTDQSIIVNYNPL